MALHELFISAMDDVVRYSNILKHYLGVQVLPPAEVSRAHLKRIREDHSLYDELVLEVRRYIQESIAPTIMRQIQQDLDEGLYNLEEVVEGPRKK